MGRLQGKVAVITGAGRKKGLGWDLHTENVLQRNGVPVIIDPYS